MTGPIRRAAGLVVLSIVTLGASPARASGYLDDWHPYQTYWAVGWSVPVPVTGMRTNLIDHPGWLSGGFDIRVGVAGRLALGVNGTWNWFDQTFPTKTIERGDFTFTGPVYRRLSSFTLLATAHYYFTRGAVQPYAGLGIGGIWATSLQQIVNLPDASSTSGLSFTGEAGVLFSVAERLGLYLSGRYQLNLTTVQGVSNPQWVSGQAGLAYYF